MEGNELVFGVEQNARRPVHEQLADAFWCATPLETSITSFS
jgi:hypothetical protein